MQDKTVSEQIKELLEKGHSSAEVIALGYRPGTVYKVQRNLRQVIEKSEELDKTPVSNQEPTEVLAAEENRSEPESLERESEVKGSAGEAPTKRNETESREWIERLRSGLEEDRLNGFKSQENKVSVSLRLCNIERRRIHETAVCFYLGKLLQDTSTRNPEVLHDRRVLRQLMFSAG